ncbi:hypothetical protein [Actinocatenispora rupis]|uniref:Lipoprotein n=1 Tax=Actinocatenispora rupis TaxID=519421 RepID=A0A8J3JDQ1_9ACTN|nr:hypothetical protein [Actinocatenispora rupis]GID14068.1 hypothetical protein Aru02nite_49570 [Actinocatenispora rupis]
MTIRTLLAAVLGASVLAGVVACNAGDDYARVCIDRHTHRRVDDRRCDRYGAGVAWWYVPHGYSAPPVGRRVDTAHGATRRPAGATVRGRVPIRGGRPFGGRPARPAPARPAPRVR